MYKNMYFLPIVALFGLLLLGPPSVQARGGDHYGGGSRQQHGQQMRKLSPEQLEKAEQIVAEARPRLQHIRQKMRETMQELRGISYNNQTEPEDLARLGRELQEQRDALQQELRILDTRLQSEVGSGARMRGYHGRGCAGLENAAPPSAPYAEAHRQH